MNHAAIQRVIAACQITDIYQRGLRVEVSPAFEATRPPAASEIQFRIHADTIERRQYEGDGEPVAALRFNTELGVRLVEPAAVEGEGAILAEIVVQYAAESRLRTECPEGDALKEFHQHNVTFHLWPYFRELVQEMCNRHRLPLIVLPMYSPLKGAEAEELAAGEAATS